LYYFKRKCVTKLSTRSPLWLVKNSKGFLIIYNNYMKVCVIKLIERYEIDLNHRDLIFMTQINSEISAVMTKVSCEIM